MSTTPVNDPLFTVRAALIMVISVLVGLAAGGLAHLGGEPPAMAVTAGLLGAGLSLPVLHALIGR